MYDRIGGRQDAQAFDEDPVTEILARRGGLSNFVLDGAVRRAERGRRRGASVTVWRRRADGAAADAEDRIDRDPW